MSRWPKSRLIASLVVTLVLGLDQLSKQWALTALGKVGSTVILPGPINLTLVFNYSDAFGLMPVSGELTRWGLAEPCRRINPGWSCASTRNTAPK